MKWLSQSTFRAAAVAAVLPLILAVVGVVLVQAQLRHRLMADVEVRLQTELEGWAALYDQRRIPAVRQAMEFRALQSDPVENAFLLVDRGGAVLSGNLAKWPVSVGMGADRQDVQLDKVRYLVATRELRGGFGLLVGIPLTQVNATLSDMQRVFVGFGIVMLLAGLGAAALIGVRAAARVERLNRFLETIGGPAGMSDRFDPGPNTPKDHAELVRHVNLMLDRIAHLFQAHQRLGDAVAHEMRTPLARIQTRLSGIDMDAAKKAGLDEEIRATIRLFDSLLRIAQMDAEAENTDGLEPVDLGQIAQGLVELYEPVAEEAGRHLFADITGDAMVLGDRQLLSQLISNLLENGIKYTDPGDRIQLELTHQGDRLHLCVSDTGPGIAPELRENIFAPFTRGPLQQEKPGHGLGLSLVRAIALRHGAKLILEDSQKGFALTVAFLHLSNH